ncbi:MAG: alpha-E domain-containing protein, partial [Polyangiaceae bacterium]
IYWMSRYVERAENVARFLDVSSQVVLDLPEAHGNPWAAVVAATGDEDVFGEQYGAPTRNSVVRFLTVDASSSNSIVSCLRHARDNARSIREAISSEMWEQINRWYLMVRDAAAGSPAIVDDPHDFLTSVKEASHQFVGVTYLTMTHGEGWHFGRLGRVLERADQTSRIIDARQMLMPSRSRGGPLHDEVDLTALLRSVSALEMYRKRHGKLDYTQVMSFLVLAKQFPRSILHCLDAGHASLEAIGGESGASSANATGADSGGTATLPERLLGRLRAEYEYAVIDEILEGRPGARQSLHDHLDQLQTKLNDVGMAVFGTFFAHRPEPAPPPASVMPAPRGEPHSADQ